MAEEGKTVPEERSQLSELDQKVVKALGIIAWQARVIEKKSGLILRLIEHRACGREGFKNAARGVEMPLQLIYDKANSLNSDRLEPHPASLFMFAVSYWASEFLHSLRGLSAPPSPVYPPIFWRYYNETVVSCAEATAMWRVGAEQLLSCFKMTIPSSHDGEQHEEERAP